MEERQDAPLDVVVRFSTSNQDLILTLDTPGLTSCLALKQRIRTHLDEPAASSRLRLIHAGKVLTDDAALSKSLKVTLPPPSADRQIPEEDKSEKAKGKQPVRDNKRIAAGRVYVHCSVGDPLTAAELSTELKAAQDADAVLASRAPTVTSSSAQASATNNANTTTPAPRGFDRLLSAGFTPAEIATLRTQFLAIQSHHHTPDTMPTGAQLLALEERWLDNPSDSNASGSVDGPGGLGGEDTGALDDMLYGNLIGFFWPLGAMFWLMREEGVWSKRKQIAVLSGFLVNLGFGFLRVMN